MAQGVVFAVLEKGHEALGVRKQGGGRHGADVAKNGDRAVADDLQVPVAVHAALCPRPALPGGSIPAYVFARACACESMVGGAGGGGARGWAAPSTHAA